MAKIEFRGVTEADIQHIAKHMKKADVSECEAFGLSPEQALRGSVANSDEAYTAVIDGDVSMIFGVVIPTVGEFGEIWALGTDRTYTIPRDMLKIGRPIIDYFLTKFPRYCNYVGAENTESITWLKHLKFHIFEPESKGLHGEMFRRIEIERKEI